MIRKLTHASWVFCAIGLAAASAPIIALEQKIAGIDVREENRSTREGKRRLAVLEKKYAEIDKKLRRSELEQFRSRMQERDHVVNEQSRSALARDVETRPRALGRAAQDEREDSGQDEERCSMSWAGGCSP